MGSKNIYLLIAAVIFARAESMNLGDFISIKTAPYFVSFIATDKHLPYCGGAIISEYWILTAAHCTMIYRTRPEAMPMQVRAGSTMRTSEGNIHQVEKVLVYSDHEANLNVGEMHLGFDDIALLKLKTPIKFSEYKQPVKVNSRLPDPLGQVTIVGLGSQGRKKGPSTSLKEATFEPSPVLMNAVNKTIPSLLVIRGFGPEVCPGDSGSPAVFNGELIGVLSGGLTCAQWKPENSPAKGAAFYTRTDLYYDWIMKYTGINV